MSKLKFTFLLLIGGVLLLIVYGELHGVGNVKSCGKKIAVPTNECLQQLHFQQNYNVDSDSQIASQAMIFAKQIDIDLMMNDVAWLADDALQGRASGFPGEDAAATWLAERYEKLQLQPYKQLGLSNHIHSFTFPYGEEYLQGENIIGVLPGESNTEEFVVVSAHYDHLGIKDGEIYNGADDNATSVAVVLEIARVLMQSEQRPQKSIIFIAFSGEEIGQVGSSNFCYEMSKQRTSHKLTALNLEMLGAIRETYINIWDQDNGLTQPIIAAVAAASRQLSMPLLISPGRDPGSDGQELLNCKFAATTMDAGGGEDFYENHPHYHAATDVPEHIDRVGFLKAAQVATIAIWRLANNDFR